MNTILNITRKTLLHEVAGISFIVREWAKILEQEVKEQYEEHKKRELEKIEKESPKVKKSETGRQTYFDFPESETGKNDPFYWEDETGKGSGSKGKSRWEDDDENWFSSWKRGEKGGKYYKKSYGEETGRYSTYGGYSGYKHTPYIPPMNEVIVDGKKYPEQYKKFSVDKWVMKSSNRIEYDHWHSGYDEEGNYIVYLNIPITSMSQGAFIHEIKHAYDDWNRMSHGGKPIRDSWEIKNIYTPDFEKLVLGGSSRYPQLGPLIRYFYLGSKLETPAYLENEYDNAMVDYEGVGRKLKNFTIDSYFNKKGEPAKGLEEEFKELQKLNIPLFKKYNNVTDFLNWVKKYFNERGEDIYRRVIKMKAVHGKPVNRFEPKPVQYTQPKGSYYSYKPEEKSVDVKKYEQETGESDDWGDFEDGETMGDWKYSKERGWYYAGEDENGNYYY